MYNNIIRVLRIALAVFVIMLTVKIGEMICVHPGDLEEQVVSSFYNEEDNTLDYIAIGSSAIQDGVFPTVIWNHNCISGNILAMDGCDSRIYLSMLKEAVLKQEECIILVDMDGFTADDGEDQYGASGRWIDLMLHNENWFETIERCDRTNRLEHYFPIFKYHKNLMDVYKYQRFAREITDRKRTLSMKGAYSLGTLERLSEGQMAKLTPFWLESEESSAIAPGRKNDLIEFLNYCRDSDIKDVIFVTMPKAYFDAERFETVNNNVLRSISCEKIVQEYGYSVINFCAENYLPDILAQDYSDSYHLKQSGAIKVSKFIGEFLASRYEFKEKTAETIENWNQSTKEAYEKYNLE